MQDMNEGMGGYDVSEDQVFSKDGMFEMSFNY